jgi:lyso-ornithine lipid O-acyltransferase
MSRLRGVLKLAGFAGLTLPLMPVQALFKATAPNLARCFPHHYHKRLCKVLGLRVTAKGYIPSSPCLIVTNHVSWLDIPCVSSVLPVSFIARHDMVEWPLFGQMAKLQRTVLVDRSRRIKTGKTRDDIVSRLRSGDTLVLFPEGTSHDGLNVLDFKSSFFAAVEDAGVPVIPATLAYHSHFGLPMTRRERPFVAWYGDMDLPQHLWDFVQRGPIDVTIHFHAPLTTSDRKTLAKTAEKTIRQSLGPMLHGH